MTHLEKPKHSPAINMETWDFGFGIADDLVKLAFSETFGGLFGSDPENGITANLPGIWQDSDGMGGPPVKDPLTIHIQLPLSAPAADEPFWSFSLETLIKEELDEDQTGLIHEDHLQFAIQLRDRLLRLSNQIDEQITRIQKEQKNL